MKRLRELEAQSALLANAQRLLEAAPPLPEDATRMRRIRRELDRPRGVLEWVRRAPALAATLLLLLFGTSAFAALRMFEWARTRNAPAPLASAEKLPQRAATPEPLLHVESAASVHSEVSAAVSGTPSQPALVTQPAAVSGTVPVAAPRTRERHASTQRAAHAITKRHASHAASPGPSAGATPSAQSQSLAAAASRSPDTRVNAAQQANPARASVERASSAAATVQPTAAADSSAASTEAKPTGDSALVHRALRALRRDGDPALASRLLARHRALHSDAGPLAEECLALQIEAAQQLHDGHAAGLARDYMARYPEGRYRSVAQQALAEPKP